MRARPRPAGSSNKAALRPGRVGSRTLPTYISTTKLDDGKIRDGGSKNGRGNGVSISAVAAPPAPATVKRVYSFGRGKSQGNASMKNLVRCWLSTSHELAM